MLEIGKANEVKFKVSVNGTAAPPVVRVVIETPNAELGFKAEKSLDGGDEWFSEVYIPENLSPGDYTMRVEAVINNRLFTPIKRKIEIAHSPVVMAAEEEDASPATPTQTPTQTRDWEGEGGALKGVQEIPTPLPPEKIHTPPLPKPSLPLPKTPPPPPKTVEPKRPHKSLMKEASKNTEQHPAPASKKRAPVKPVVPEVVVPAILKKQAVKTGIVPPKDVKEGQIRIKMCDIMAESEARFDDVLSASASYKKPGKAVVPMNIQTETPVTLTKGEVIYE
jgi:hypothetical protein